MKIRKQIHDIEKRQVPQIGICDIWQGNRLRLKGKAGSNMITGDRKHNGENPHLQK